MQSIFEEINKRFILKMLLSITYLHNLSETNVYALFIMIRMLRYQFCQATIHLSVLDAKLVVA